MPLVTPNYSQNDTSKQYEDKLSQLKRSYEICKANYIGIKELIKYDFKSIVKFIQNPNNQILIENDKIICDYIKYRILNEKDYYYLAIIPIKNIPKSLKDIINIKLNQNIMDLKKENKHK